MAAFEEDADEWALSELDRCVQAVAASRLRRLARHPARTLTARVGREAGRRGLGVPLTGTTFWGDRIRGYAADPVSEHIYRFGYFDADLTAALIRLLQPGMQVIDIGAHTGYFSLLAAALVGRGGRVAAFEPTPRTFRLLAENTAHAAPVQASAAAVSAAPGRVTLADYGPAFAAFNSAVAPRIVGQRPPATHLEVPAVTVDSFCCETALEPTVLKIDAETSEMLILQGAHDTLDKASPLLIVEVGDMAADSPHTSRQLVDAVMARGYRPYELTRGSPRPHTPRDVYEYENLLFVPGRLPSAWPASWRDGVGRVIDG